MTKNKRFFCVNFLDLVQYSEKKAIFSPFEGFFLNFFA
jgi:hypothetical protein